MDYKKIMGYGEKKVIKKQPKPKVNKVLENIKEEFTYLKEFNQLNETLPVLGKEYKDFKKAEKLYIQSIRKLAMKAGKVEKVYDKQIMHSLKVFLGKGMEKFKDALDDVLRRLQ